MANDRLAKIGNSLNGLNQVKYLAQWDLKLLLSSIFSFRCEAKFFSFVFVRPVLVLAAIIGLVGPRL